MIVAAVDIVNDVAVNIVAEQVKKMHWDTVARRLDCIEREVVAVVASVDTHRTAVGDVASLCAAVAAVSVAAADNTFAVALAAHVRSPPRVASRALLPWAHSAT